MLMLMNAWMMLVLMKCKCQMQSLTLGCYIVCCCLCYQHLVCSRGYEQAREGEGPKSVVKRVSLVELFVYYQVPKPLAAQTC